MNQPVMITTTQGGLEVDADVFGNLAVHQCIGFSGLGRNLFSLTYAPTGKLINTWQDKQNAIDAARHLAPHFDGVPNKSTPEWKVWQSAVWSIIRRLEKREEDLRSSNDQDEESVDLLVS